MITPIPFAACYERRRRRVLIKLGKALIDYRNALQRAKKALKQKDSKLEKCKVLQGSGWRFLEV